MNTDSAVDIRAIPGFPDYWITPLGLVYSTKNAVPMVLKPLVEKSGYKRFGLCVGSKTKTVRLHRLIAITFLPPRPSPEHVIRHLDGNADNCHPSNLAWGTQQENIEDKLRHGTSAIGERNGKHTCPELVLRGNDCQFSKLREHQVIEIIKRLAAGEKGNALAREFNVVKATISAIKNGRTWGHLTRDAAILKPEGWNPPQIEAILAKAAQ